MSPLARLRVERHCSRRVDELRSGEMKVPAAGMEAIFDIVKSKVSQ